jgi:hypothetical protein
MLTFVVGQVGALTPPERKHLREELTIEVDPEQLLLCVGEKESVVVTVKRHGVYEDVRGPRSVRRPRPYRLENNFWGPERLSVRGTYSGDAATATDLEQDADVRAGRDYRARYEFVGTEVGVTTVEFVAEQAGAGSARASLVIEVTECDYRVVAASIWHIDATGWNTVVGASIRTEIYRPSSPQGIYITNGQVFAKTVAVEFPAFNCGSSITHGEVRVLVTGAPLTDQDLGVRLDYPDSISGSKFVTCTSRRIPGDSQATGSLNAVEFEFGIGGGHGEAPHILHAGGLGDFTGMTFMTVTPIHR